MKNILNKLLPQMADPDFNFLEMRSVFARLHKIQPLTPLWKRVNDKVRLIPQAGSLMRWAINTLLEHETTAMLRNSRPSARGDCGGKIAPYASAVSRA